MWQKPGWHTRSASVARVAQASHALLTAESMGAAVHEGEAAKEMNPYVLHVHVHVCMCVECCVS